MTSTNTILTDLALAAERDNTVWHTAKITLPDGSLMVVSIRKYHRTGPQMWKLDGWRASLATIKAAANGAELSFLPGNRAVLA